MNSKSQAAENETSRVNFDDPDTSKLIIKYKNLKKFMQCVLCMALTSRPEVMLDYPVDKLAQATAEKCMQYAGVTDRKNGVISLAQLTQFISTANTTAIFSQPNSGG